MPKSHYFLAEMITHKRDEVEHARKLRTEEELRTLAQARPHTDRRNFIEPLRAVVSAGGMGVIAELKKGSPSAGVLREDYQPRTIACDYERGGAHCLSVLTDEKFFKGAHTHLGQARAACYLPVLRKDFILSPYQVYESAAMGADAVLLIAAVFDDAADLQHLAELAIECGMSVLLEIHQLSEWREHSALAREEDVLVGINNRDLRTFEVDTQCSVRLAPEVIAASANPVISESGISDAKQLQTLRACGIHCFLIGSALMREPQPGSRLRELMA